MTRDDWQFDKSRRGNVRSEAEQNYNRISDDFLTKTTGAATPGH